MAPSFTGSAHTPLPGSGTFLKTPADCAFLKDFYAAIEKLLGIVDDYRKATCSSHTKLENPLQLSSSLENLLNNIAIGLRET
jgi:hypothetical protein